VNCTACGSPVEGDREEMGLKVCMRCAFNGVGQQEIKGRMVYSHKTGGEIEIMSAESFEENKKYFQPQGARSCVKNFSKSICK